MGDYYARQRKEGRSVLGAGAAVVGTGLGMLWNGITGGKESTLDDAEKKKHRDTALNQTSQLESGGTAQMIQEEVLKASANKSEEEARAREAAEATAKEAAETNKYLKEILDKFGAGEDSIGGRTIRNVLGYRDG